MIIGLDYTYLLLQIKKHAALNTVHVIAWLRATHHC